MSFKVNVKTSSGDVIVFSPVSNSSTQNTRIGLSGKESIKSFTVEKKENSSDRIIDMKIDNENLEEKKYAETLLKDQYNNYKSSPIKEVETAKFIYDSTNHNYDLSELYKKIAAIKS